MIINYDEKEEDVSMDKYIVRDREEDKAALSDKNDKNRTFMSFQDHNHAI